MTSCPHCGSVRVIMDHARDGHPYLRDYGANHYYKCPAQNGPKAKKPKAKKKEPPSKSLVELMSLNMSEEDADKIIKAHPGMSDDELIMVALKEMGAPDGSD